jgi:hypothetical protein
MGTYAFLANLEPIDRVIASAPEVEAKHHVPIFWLAMFDVGDLRDEPYTGVRYHGKETLFAIQPPYLITDQASAIARLKKRSAALGALVGETHKKLLRDFTAFARRLKPSMVVRLDDLSDGAGFGERVRATLRQVATLDDAAARAETYLVEPLAQLSLDPAWETSEQAPALLSGWGWQVSPEERAKRARERKWQKTVGDRADANLVPYAASHTFAPDDLLAHPTLGPGLVIRVVDGSKVEVLFRDGTRTLIHGRK